MKDKPKVTRKRSSGSGSFERAIAELNREIVYKTNSKDRLSKFQAMKKFKEYRGRCAFCGVPLQAARSSDVDLKLHYMFYTPLDLGGSVNISNVVPVCYTHKQKFLPIKKRRLVIPDYNSVPDLIEKLIEFKLDEREAPDKDTRIKIKAVKREINFQLEEIANHMRYLTFSDWQPENFVIFHEDEDSIPDVIEDMIDSPKEKEVLKENIKQVLWTKDYKVTNRN